MKDVKDDDNLVISSNGVVLEVNERGKLFYKTLRDIVERMYRRTFHLQYKNQLNDSKNQVIDKLQCNVPIFGSHCYVIGDDFQGLGQHDHRGSLKLLVNSKGLDGLYDAQSCSLIIFHHWDHSCVVNLSSGAVRLFP
jgi:hypothetical protein